MLNVSVVLGDASADICDKVSKRRDDFNLIPYSSLGELFRESEYTQFAINRVVVSSKVLELGDVSDNISRLRDLIRSQSEFSSVVFLCKEETDSDLESVLLSSFAESECAVLSIFSSSVNDIIEYISLGIADLQGKYGFKPEGLDAVSVLDDSVDYVEEKTEEVGETAVVNDVHVGGRKKSGFFDALFGKSKKQTSDTEVIDDEVSASSGMLAPPMVSEEIVSEERNVDEVVNVECEVSDVPSAEEGVSNLSESELSDGVSENSSSQEVLEDTPVIVESEGDEVAECIDMPVESEDVDCSQNSTRNILDEVKTQPELIEVIDDNNLLSDTDEGEYREKTARVVERVVERVVTVPSSGGVRSVFDKTSKRLVLVTGDRRSGVTTMAYNLAVTFSKYMRVLYVDCDIVRHGILSLINYSEFLKHDRATKEALTLTDWNSLSASAFSVSKSLDVITSDYGVNLTKDNIACVLDILADYYTSYDFVVVDLPLEHLDCASSVLSLSKTLLLSEGCFNGLLTLLTECEVRVCKSVPARYMNLLSKRGTLVFNKVVPNFNPTKVMKSIGSMLDLDYPWLSMRFFVQPQMDEVTLGSMLEV